MIQSQNSVNIFVFLLKSLFWKAKTQDKERYSSIYDCNVFLFSCNEVVAVVYWNSVYRIWCYGDIYGKSIDPFQWLSNLYLKKKTMHEEKPLVKWVNLIVIWSWCDIVIQRKRCWSRSVILYKIRVFHSL